MKTLIPVIIESIAALIITVREVLLDRDLAAADDGGVCCFEVAKCDLKRRINWTPPSEPLSPAGSLKQVFDVERDRALARIRRSSIMQRQH